MDHRQQRNTSSQLIHRLAVTTPLGSSRKPAECLCRASHSENRGDFHFRWRVLFCAAGSICFSTASASAYLCMGALEASRKWTGSLRFCKAL